MVQIALTVFKMECDCGFSDILAAFLPKIDCCWFSLPYRLRLKEQLWNPQMSHPQIVKLSLPLSWNEKTAKPVELSLFICQTAYF